MQICVIGAGYVGLTSAAALASLGHRVACMDRDEEKIQSLIGGQIPFYEPGLKDLVRTGLDTGRLKFYFDLHSAVGEAELVFICVGTPLDSRENVDLSAVFAVARELAKENLENKIIIVKSTVPVGTTKQIADILNPSRGEEDWGLIGINPEFLREGSAVKDFFYPDRIVIGSWDRRVEKALKQVYEGFNCPFLVTDPSSAEMIKYAANAFLALKISFVNELANLCDLLSIDVKPVLLGMGMDKRIGNNYLQPGIGFGGSCLPKDLVGLIALCRQQNYPGLLFNAVKSINELQPEYLVRRILATIEPSGVEIELAILGLSFKPGTDDIRSAPALKLIDLFYQQGMKIRAYDPVVKSLPGEYGEKVKIYPTALEAIRGVQVVIIATEWEEFKQLNWEGVRDAEDDFLIGDGRNLLDPEEMGKLGIRYLGIGRRNGVEK